MLDFGPAWLSQSHNLSSMNYILDLRRYEVQERSVGCWGRTYCAPQRRHAAWRDLDHHSSEQRKGHVSRRGCSHRRNVHHFSGEKFAMEIPHLERPSPRRWADRGHEIPCLSDWKMLPSIVAKLVGIRLNITEMIKCTVRISEIVVYYWSAYVLPCEIKYKWISVRIMNLDDIFTQILICTKWSDMLVKNISIWWYIYNWIMSISSLL